MKLRNKKTGEMIEGKCFTDIVKKLHERGDVLCYGSLLNVDLFTEYWEEIDSSEPLIKDEKIRKAIRAWAEACAVEKCHYDGDGDFATRWHGIKLDGSQIELDEGHYTIAELCGEEEE